MFPAAVKRTSIAVVGEVASLWSETYRCLVQTSEFWAMVPRPKWIPNLNCPPARVVGRDDLRNRFETTSTLFLDASDCKVHVPGHQKRKVQYRPAGPLITAKSHEQLTKMSCSRFTCPRRETTVIPNCGFLRPSPCVSS